jgi:glycerol-3-phosphate responsive antiterminator
MYTAEDIQQALDHGMAAVSTSSRELWQDLINK